MSKGYVYILSNPSMPGIVKIGRTTRSVSGRANELFQTGVPTPFAVEGEIYCPDCEGAEKIIHEVFEDDRVNPNREFFRSDPIRVYEILQGIVFSQVGDFVRTFFEGHTVTDESMTVDALHLHRLCEKTNRHPYEVISAIEMLDPSELDPGFRRYDERVAEMKNHPNVITLTGGK